MTDIAESTARASQILAQGRVVVLAGSGLLASAGLQSPEARGGLWDRHDPSRCATPTALTATPNEAWRAFGEYLAQSRVASCRMGGPSPAHRSLWALEQRGLLRGVVDLTTAGLVRAAGLTHVSEFFGSIDRLRCQNCRTVSEVPLGAEQDWSAGRFPQCFECRGALRPDMVLFEESMPVEPRARAAKWVYGGRSLLILGANIRKPPMRNMPLEMRQEGGQIVALGDVDPECLKRVRGLWIKGGIDANLARIVQSLPTPL